jgi:hypothetical protein
VKTQVHIVGNDFLIFRPDETAAEPTRAITALKDRRTLAELCCGGQATHSAPEDQHVALFHRH